MIARLDSRARPFKDVAVGERFHFSRYAQSGLLADLNQPGFIVYVKRSTRTYTRVGDQTVMRVGSIKAKTWPV